MAKDKLTLVIDTSDFTKKAKELKAVMEDLRKAYNKLPWHVKLRLKLSDIKYWFKNAR